MIGNILEDSELSIIDCDRIRYNEREGVFIDFLNESNFVRAVNKYGWRCSPVFRIYDKGNGLEGHGPDVKAVYIVFVAGSSQEITIRYYQMGESKNE